MLLKPALWEVRDPAVAGDTSRKPGMGGDLGYVCHQMLIVMIVNGNFIACAGTLASVSPLSKLLSCVYLVNDWLQLLIV